MLQMARQYTEIGIQKLWSGKLFVREPGDPYYEAKLNTSSLVAGFLRLHLIEHNEMKEATLSYWSL